MLKLSDIFRICTLQHQRKRVELLDPQTRRPLLSAEGETREEATLNLLEKLRSLFRAQPWEPLLLERGGYRVMVYATPSGWRNNLVYAQPDGITYEVSPSGVSTEPTREDAERLARRQLAQLSWQLGEKESPVLRPDDEEGRRDFTSWVAFQECFLEAISLGYSDGEAHYVASGFLDMANELRAKREQAEAERRELVLAATGMGEDETVVDVAMQVKEALGRSTIPRKARTLAEELQRDLPQVERALALLVRCAWVGCSEVDGVKQYVRVPRRPPQVGEMRLDTGVSPKR